MATWFVAVALPEPAVTHLAGAVRAVQREWPALRWVPADRWHLTLAFLGPAGPVLPETLRERLARAVARHTAPRLRLSAGGAFARPAAARVLWVGLGGDRDGLRGLAGSVLAAARRAGIPGAGHPGPYRPHVTLARTRTPTDLRDQVARLRDYDGPEWVAAEVRLVRSDPGPPAAYRTLASWSVSGRIGA